jgi:uncharacterized protein YcaQ
MKPYPISALRTVALHTQGLGNAEGSAPTRDRMYEIINQIGCIQIDTLHMVRRSQYLVLWSRLGNYAPEDFDGLASAANRRIFEGWQHAASLIPISEYRYQLPRQRKMRDQPSTWYNRLLDEALQKEIVPQVLDRIRSEGALKVSNFESDGHRGGAWWNWRPAKVALEILYSNGDLMIADRVKFQRLYDLTGRVLPPWVDRTEPTTEERDRFWVELGARALGVCQPRHAGDYTWMGVSHARPIVAELVKDGILIPITGEQANGESAELIIHRDNLPLLEQAADGSLKAVRTTFLSPFDNLWWAKGRDEQLWGFHQSIEAYLPAPKRVYGYFCLPILHNDRLVGRFDPKLERKTGVLRLRALYLEPGIEPTEELLTDLADCMRDFMAFHAARELVIERSEPAGFAEKLLTKL